MNNKALTLSIFMAIVAVFFVESYVSSIEEETKRKFGTEVMVVVAKKDIKEMDTVNETMIETKLIPKRFLEPSAIHFEGAKEDKDFARSMRELVGTVAVVPIKKGEQISFNKISDPSLRTGLAPQIAPGKRAMAIPVNEVSAVGKLVKPGDRVDVIAIVDPGGGKDQKISKTVLQDVVVLAVGKSVTNNAARVIEQDPGTGKDRVRSLADDFSFGSVTLEVDPLQAQTMALIMAGGDSTLMISLRNNDDGERYNLNTTTFGDLLGADAARLRMPAGRR
ncbi:MAG: Flp pilus assembly protein CpaB [Oligoflexia bacterium]|nr:Flp pilus assembly protein CpaB [Oligoflexia bacterium]